MCLILLAYGQHPRYPLMLAANRDEFYDRPTAAASYWEDAPDLFAGRDLVHGGTWLGITRDGRFAALTNYREPHAERAAAPSRGELVSRFLKSGVGAKDYLEQLRRQGGAYHGFNLVFGCPDALYCYSNRNGQAVRIAPGIHGLSNHLFDTPWPKVVRGKNALAEVAQLADPASEDLFSILADRTRAPDELLPDTGIGLEWERLLSPIFIASERYGTRSSTVLLLDTDRRVTIVERTFNGSDLADVATSFQIG